MPARPIVLPSDVRGYSFGPFVADTVRRLLWRDRQVVALSSKTFDLLTILLVNRNRIVSKGDLLRLIWPDAVVQENNLVRQVSTLRRALGERPDQHDFIVTVSGQGYRFVGDVRELDDVPKEMHGPNGSAPLAASSPIGDAFNSPGCPFADLRGPRRPPR